MMLSVVGLEEEFSFVFFSAGMLRLLFVGYITSVLGMLDFSFRARQNGKGPGSTDAAYWKESARRG